MHEYSRAIRPLLLAWAPHHDDLREITSDQVRHQLTAARAGWARQMTFVAVRSLFGFLRRDGRVFRNPTARLHRGAQPPRPVLPLTADDYARVTARATTPLHRAVLVLVAVHGARPHMVRNRQLTDVATTHGRLTIGGVPRPLEGVSATALRDWLHTRRQRWPLTANPHLIISKTAALSSTAQISRVTLSSLFASSGVSLDRLRMDRYLEEAFTYGPDPLHLSSLFGISDATALRYTTLARHLMTAP